MELLKIKDAHKELSISETTLRRKIKAGKISYIKMGRLYFFTPEIIQEYLDANKVPMKKEDKNEDS
jgi:excisionase family DNA binding protein